jgi:hypothetical protein
MPESNETREPRMRSRIVMNMTGGQKVFVGCFAIWCATGVANSFFTYKIIDKKLALESLKAAANQVK